ncbi:MAG: hypothetical protein IJ561_08420 [Ruminococcus sp.]|nr:hypothetical protein [Ruminococcus sp.]
MKKIKANQQGAVLVTVLCVTLVCMIVAATALKLASYTNQESTLNVQRTQAQVMSENYLNYYLETFKEQDPVTKKVVYNFDSLNDLAKAATAETPKVVTVSLRDKANVAVDTTTAYGGVCKIYIYKSGSGVIVKSEVTYGNAKESTKAYFDGKTKQPFQSNNTIETTGGYTPTESAYVNGDIMIETLKELDADGNEKESNDYTTFHNNKGGHYYSGNVYTTANLLIGVGTTNITFGDSIQQKNVYKAMAPTITAEGNIILNGIYINTSVGKIDYNGKRISAGTDYGKNGLSNKDGYINAFGTILNTQNGACDIGSDKHEIDVYCSNAIFGSVTQAETNSNLYSIYSGLTGSNKYPGGEGSNTVSVWPQTNAKLNMYGNFYVYKGTGSARKGDFADNSNGGGSVIHGDLYVEGNVYILGVDLKVDGKVCINGDVYKNGVKKVPDDSDYPIKKTDGTKATIGTFSKPTDIDARGYQPTKEYAPGLYQYDVSNSKHINGTMSYPSTYLNYTPNDMYKDNSNDAKKIADKYIAALKNPLKGNAWDTNDKNKIYDGNDPKAITYDNSCRLTASELNNSDFKLTIEVAANDVVVAVPANVIMNCQIRVVRRDDLLAAGQTLGYCYVMLYDPSKILDSSGNLDNAKLKTYTEFKTGTSSDDLTYYLRDESKNTSVKLLIEDNARKYIHIANKDIFDFDISAENAPETIGSKTTNIMLLLPDGSTLKYNSNCGCGLNCIVYGPKATFDRSGYSGDGNRFFGQVKVRKYNLPGDFSKYTTENVYPADDSILTFINAKNASDGSLKFLYYLKNE